MPWQMGTLLSSGSQFEVWSGGGLFQLDRKPLSFRREPGFSALTRWRGFANIRSRFKRRDGWNKEQDADFKGWRSQHVRRV